MRGPQRGVKARMADLNEPPRQREAISDALRLAAEGTSDGLANGLHGQLCPRSEPSVKSAFVKRHISNGCACKGGCPSSGTQKCFVGQKLSELTIGAKL